MQVCAPLETSPAFCKPRALGVLGKKPHLHQCQTQPWGGVNNIHMLGQGTFTKKTHGNDLDEAQPQPREPRKLCMETIGHAHGGLSVLSRRLTVVKCTVLITHLSCSFAVPAGWGGEVTVGPTGRIGKV